MIDLNEDVSTTDDEFQRRCPRMMTGVNILSNLPGKGKVRAVTLDHNHHSINNQRNNERIRRCGDALRLSIDSVFDLIRFYP